MTIRYELRPRGVYDRETDRVILPEDLAWLDYEKWLQEGNTPEEPPPPAPPGAAAVRAEKIAAVERMAASLRRQVTDRASPSEMASWTVKMSQAELWRATGDDSKAPLLVEEAKARGVSIESIVSRIANNAALFQSAEAQIAGVSGRHKDALKALETREDIEAYDIKIGWPRLGAAPRVESDQV